MTTIVTRTNKTTELLYAEGDANLNLDVIAASVDPGIGLESNRSTYECTSTFNFTLPLASSMISPTPGSTAKCNDYRVTIKNAGSGTITVKTTSPNTLDGVAATGDQAILPNEAFEYQVNFGKDGWISTSKVSASALSAAAVITTNALVKGSDGTRNVEASGVIVDGSNNVSGVAKLTTTGDIELGNATDTTIARASAGNITVEGKTVYRADGTDVPVVDGGTGSSTAAGALTSLGAAAAADWASTSISIATSSAPTTYSDDWAHGLGTDDLDITYKLIGGTGSGTGAISAGIIDANSFEPPLYHLSTQIFIATTPAAPSAGNIRAYVRSALNQTVTFKITARKR